MRVVTALAFLATVVAGCHDTPTQPAATGDHLAAITVEVVVPTLAVGQSTIATAAGVDANGAGLALRGVRWSSSNTGVVQVDSLGRVFAVAVGQAEVIATVDNVSGRDSVTVHEARVGAVFTDPANLTVPLSQSAQLTALVDDENGTRLTGRAVQWSSADSTIASVDSAGRVTGRREGFVLITATCEGRSGTANVTVIGPAGIAAATPGTIGIGAPLTFALDGPRTVLVRYADSTGAPMVERLATVSPAAPTITLYRLAAGRTYRYWVYSFPDTLATSAAITGSFVTPPLPAGLAALSFSVTGASTEGLLMWEVGVTGGWKGFVATDDRGQVVWYYETVGASQGATRRANGNFVLNDLGRGLLEVTPAGTVVHVASESAHHDAVATAANTVIFIGHDVRSVPGIGTLWGDGIFEWTPETGAVVQRFSTFDWFDPRGDWGSRSSNVDWLHANALAIGPHGNVLLSLNWISEIVSIAPGWNTLEWRLGGWNSTFAIDSAASFSGQHSVSMPTEGHVLMFDNGRERTGSGQYSRGLEVSLDPTAKRASLAWQFAPTPANFAPYIGHAERLANGNTQVHFGLNAGPFGGEIASGPIVSYEVTPAGTQAFRAEALGATSIYRSWPLAAIDGERVVR